QEITQVTVEDMKALQFDNFHLHASEALPAMLQLLMEDPALTTTQEEEGLLAELQKWDFYTSPLQTEPPLFAEWWNTLEEMIWGRWKEEGRPVLFPNSYQTTRLLREE